MAKKKARCLTATVRLYGMESPDGRLVFNGGLELREVFPGECEGTKILPILQVNTDSYLRGFLKRDGRRRI